jgi:protein-S-isoprenylcysteine O-methyltransferase Ste14
MKTSMTLGGIGPKLALLCLPYIILSILVMRRYPDFFDLGFLDSPDVRVLGFVGLGAGMIFWMSSGLYFLRHFKAGKLMTKGPFALCRNPIYSSILVFIIPSLALVLHSGLIFSISLVMYIGFKISIHGESHLLRSAFGEEFERYEKSVNEIIPFPRYLFGGKASDRE